MDPSLYLAGLINALAYVFPHFPEHTTCRSSPNALTSTGGKSVGGHSGSGHFHWVATPTIVREGREAVDPLMT
jgi:hypothetical protein